jgi:hypothetical protein
MEEGFLRLYVPYSVSDCIRRKPVGASGHFLILPDQRVEFRALVTHQFFRILPHMHSSTGGIGFNQSLGEKRPSIGGIAMALPMLRIAFRLCPLRIALHLALSRREHHTPSLSNSALSAMAINRS